MTQKSSLHISLVGGAWLLLSSVVQADISGNVFRDYNSNGVKDNTSSFNESGVGGVSITCTDSAGGTGSTTSSTDAATLGAYTLTGCIGESRVEFNWSLAGDFASVTGADNNTSVQFVNAPQSNINLGVTYPAEYCEADPRLAVAVQLAGNGKGFTLGDGTWAPYNALDGALRSFPASTSGNFSANNRKDLTQQEIGSTWGLAYDKLNKRIFQATFLKRHAGLKADLGTIFIGTETSTAITYSNSFSLQGITAANLGTAIDFGTVCRDATCAKEAGHTGNASDYEIPGNPTDYHIDLDAFGKVGKAGLGGLEITPDGKQLWAVNLYQRALIRMDASLANTAYPGNVQQYLLDGAAGIPACNNGIFRPFGLSFYRDKGYLGGVCDASISQDSNDLIAYVLAFDPNNPTNGFTTVVNFSLNYNRGTDWQDTTSSSPSWLYGQWHPWKDNWSDYGINNNSWVIYNAVPILSDIAFSDDGSMTLALMDRFAHQVGTIQRRPIASANDLMDGRSSGDLVHFCKDNAGIFHIEGSSQCPINFSDNKGPSNNGEYYNDIGGDGNSESATGSIAYWHGTHKMATTLVDPYSYPIATYDTETFYTQGIQWLDTQSGGIVDYFRVHDQYQSGKFGKGAGLGEIELLCPPAPIEIGNRVWLDTNQNGIQDPNEQGIPDVPVQLLSGVTVLATATTAADGSYYFTSVAGTSTASKIMGLTDLQADKTYTVKFPNTVTVGGNTYGLTSAANGSNRQLDSNASPNGDVTIAAADIPVAGANNHSFDVGYSLAQADLKLDKKVSPSQTVRGSTVTFTLTVTNEGNIDATNTQVQDLLPAALEWVSDDSAGTYLPSSGDWTIGALAKGASKTLNMVVRVK